MGNRIPIPGGGSAIQKRSTTNDPQTSKSSRTSHSSKSVDIKKSPSLDRENETRHSKRAKESRFASKLDGLINAPEITRPVKRPVNKKPPTKPIHIPRKTQPEAVASASYNNTDIPIPVLEAAGCSYAHSAKRNATTELEDCSNPSKKLKFSDIPEKTSNISSHKTQQNSNSTKSNHTNSRTTSSVNTPNVRSGILKGGKMSNTSIQAPQKANVISVNMTANHRITWDKILLNVLQWNYKWLEEQNKSQEAPPVFHKGKLQNVKITYSSIDDYVNTYYPLLLFELWESVHKDWKATIEKEHFKFVMSEYSECREELALITFDTVTDVKEVIKSSFPKEGYLVHFDLRIQNGDEIKLTPVLGYVVEYAQMDESHNTWKENEALVELVKTNKYSNPIHVKLTVKLKKRNATPKLNKHMPVKCVSYVKPALRQAEALSTLHLSYLSRYMLIPRYDTFKLIVPKNAILYARGCYNKLQKNAILGAAQAGLSPYTIPRLVLLQGPPGTGKTFTCIGLIQQMLFSKSEVDLPCKLLVLAPSNAAVDEIGRRLIQVQEYLLQKHSHKRMNIIRIGQPGSVHPDVAPLMLTSLISSNQKQSRKSQQSKLDKELEDLETAIRLQEASLNGINTVIEALMSRNKPYSKEEKQLRDLYLNISKLQKRKQILLEHGKNPNFFKSHEPSGKIRKDILQNSDVVLSTLNSCRQSILEGFFGGKNSTAQFSCCIVDEATQCSEPEILMPFQYGFTKLILIGDPKQLPATVTSRKAEHHGYQQSLFERLFTYFESNEDSTSNPVVMLNEQYRMHSEICHFPSTHFYKSKLVTPASVDAISKKFPFKPYTVINLIDSQEKAPDNSKMTSHLNEKEAKFLVGICLEIKKRLSSKCTIGVITPYNGQCVLMRKMIGNSANDVEINTVDSFQGREKDVVIFSCVRANSEKNIGFLSSPKRLNVAITRASKCLIICGHLASLEKHQHWSQLIEDARQRKLIMNANSSQNPGEFVESLRKN